MWGEAGIFVFPLELIRDKPRSSLPVNNSESTHSPVFINPLSRQVLLCDSWNVCVLVDQETQPCIICLYPKVIVCFPPSLFSTTCSHKNVLIVEVSQPCFCSSCFSSSPNGPIVFLGVVSNPGQEDSFKVFIFLLLKRSSTWGNFLIGWPIFGKWEPFFLNPQRYHKPLLVGTIIESRNGSRNPWEKWMCSSRNGYLLCVDFPLCTNIVKQLPLVSGQMVKYLCTHPLTVAVILVIDKNLKISKKSVKTQE